VISDVRFACQRDRHNLLGLIVVERLEDETVEVFDVERSAAGLAGGLSGTFGQEVSWRLEAGRDVAAAARADAIGDTIEVAQRELPLRTSDRAAGEGI